MTEDFNKFFIFCKDNFEDGKVNLEGIDVEELYRGYSKWLLEIISNQAKAEGIPVFKYLENNSDENNSDETRFLPKDKYIVKFEMCSFKLSIIWICIKIFEGLVVAEKEGDTDE